MNLPLTLKLKKNLFISKNTVISYTTPVAKIEKGKLIDLGKFSRTTGKHLSYVQDLLGIERVRVEKKQLFWRYEYGVDCEMENSLSPAISKIFTENLSSLDQTVQSLSKVKKFSPKDWPLIEKFLISNNVSVDTFQKLQRAQHLIQFI